ncbi:glycosyl hydrolase family 35 [Colletotrichum salicis]|uniref:beta-galactosidase n=1 Tax=Colletotrichum salicis TaxID=1209931 RepID=A0A135V482_9PEZI|nr:glycosyl hydrolase family 35 [Colletotrichum salicis]
MAPDYTKATENYISSVLRVISAAQITNGGPIIFVQPENEYSLAVGTANPVESTKLLDPNYMVFMEDQFRRNSIVVPLIGNDAVPLGNWAPGSGKGELDIYAHDAYPFYKGCDHPSDWTDLTALSLTYTYQNHLQQSPSSPYAVLEYQGGAPDPWGGIGLDKYIWRDKLGKHGSLRGLHILYGGAGEEHEFAVPSSLKKPLFEDSNATTRNYGSFRAVHWKFQERRQVVHFDNLEVHLLWRDDAYQNWILDLPDAGNRLIRPTQGNSSILAKGSYLLRNATFSDGVLHLTGDINATTTLEVLGGVPMDNTLSFNIVSLSNVQRKNGRLQAEVVFESPTLNMPVFSELEWHSIDSLPEVSNGYDDSSWTEATLERSNNPRNLTTPTSLYCSDYGFHGGSLIYRGHFTASGNESFFNVATAGGFAYSHSVWVNETFLASFTGDSHTANSTQVFDLRSLKLVGPSVFTVVIDHMGMSMNFWARSDWMKLPRGIVDFSLGGHQQSDMKWKPTGNSGAEDYTDKTGGPLNEGAFYAERYQELWVAFYKTEVPLDMPIGYDISLSFVISNVTASTGEASLFRAQLFVNGYQFVNYLGPQTRFPIPEGILNYNDNNTVALTLWALDGSGARLEGPELAADHIVQSGYRKPGQTA